jgi:hypothetical protein
LTEDGIVTAPTDFGALTPPEATIQAPTGTTSIVGAHGNAPSAEEKPS